MLTLRYYEFFSIFDMATDKICAMNCTISSNVELHSIITGGRHAQTLTVPVGPVHLNSGASMDPRG